MTDSRYDFYLFDLDGTIIDVEFSYTRRLFDRIGRRIGYEFTDTEVFMIWHGLQDSRNALIERTGVAVDQFWDIFHEEENPIDRAKASFIYDDATVIPTLEQPVGVVTHCQSYLTYPVLEQLEITDWFNTVVCCSEETGWKPDPNPVYEAMRDLGVISNGYSGVYVGDSPHDIDAAWNAGLDGVHIERHEATIRNQEIAADRRINQLAELIN